MNDLKSHFWYNTSQRNGVLFLVILIIALQLIYFFVDFSKEDTTDLNSNKVAKFQKEIDSLKQIELANRKPKIYPFNPSFLTDYRGYQLGMSTEEIDRLLQHRANGNYINSVAEFQSVTKVNDSLLKTISPYFKFPEWVKNRNNNPRIFNNQKVITKNIIKKDLNTANARNFHRLMVLEKSYQNV